MTTLRVQQHHIYVLSFQCIRKLRFAGSLVSYYTIRRWIRRKESKSCCNGGGYCPHTQKSLSFDLWYHKIFISSVRRQIIKGKYIDATAMYGTRRRRRLKSNKLPFLLILVAEKSSFPVRDLLQRKNPQENQKEKHSLEGHTLTRRNLPSNVFK